MTIAAQQILDAFDRLTNADRQVVARELLKKASEVTEAPLTDEMLDLIAEDRFAELDSEEAARGFV